MSTDGEKIDRPSYQALEEALNCMKKAYDLMKGEALELQKEKEAFDSVAKKLEHVNFASTVKLNVGGQLFSTSLQTLKKDPGSMLHAMFSERFDTKPAEDGTYFIDRDGTHFRYILNYLRTGRLLVPDDRLVQKELLEEAEFYQIRGIIDELCPQPFLESKILSDEHKDIMINQWLKDQLDLPHSTFVLLYRASRDGWSTATFHTCCDKRGPTVVVVKSNDSLFGGFTEQSWDSSGSYKYCNESFIFSLVNPSGSVPTKLPLKPDQTKYGIYCNSGYGPTFGGGHDLTICEDANSSSKSYSSLGNSYECPRHITSTFLTEERTFLVSEVEVFGLKKWT